MAINFSTMVYRPAYNVFARPVTFTGNAEPKSGRGIYSTEALDVPAEDGSIVSTRRTILDVLEEEFTTLPKQHDRVDIPAHLDLPALGLFEIIDDKSNGGGETTLQLRKIVVAKP
jgi:hypothetical protein